jgi:hypothetical protein
METLDYDYQDFQRERVGDERLRIRFFKKAMPDPVKSVEEGRPIFVERDYIQINSPGDRSNVIVKPVKPGGGYALRFAKQYDHWKATQTNMEAEGTPLEIWGKMSLSQIEEYRYFGIRTVDHLANLRDDVMLKIPGSADLKRRAQAFVQLAKEEAPIKKLQEEIESRDTELSSLKIALEDQGRMIKELRDSMHKVA